jgi:hypothetical protein
VCDKETTYCRTERRTSARSEGQNRLLTTQAQHEREQHARPGGREDLSVSACSFLALNIEKTPVKTLNIIERSGDLRYYTPRGTCHLQTLFGKFIKK